MSSATSDASGCIHHNKPVRDVHLGVPLKLWRERGFSSDLNDLFFGLVVLGTVIVNMLQEPQDEVTVDAWRKLVFQE